MRVNYANVGRMLLVAILALVFGIETRANSNENIIDSLAKKGFENLRCVEGSHKIIYTVENNVYKLQPKGVTEALKTIEAAGGVDSLKQCAVIFTDMSIPKLCLTKVGNGWKATNYGYSADWKAVKNEKKTKSSFGDIDLVIYPQLYHKNIIINQMYFYLLEVSPALEVTLWPGAKLTGQIIFPVLNDGYSSEYKNIRPGYLTLQQSFRLPHDSWGDVRLGVFDTRTYGVETNFRIPLDGNHWYLNGRAGYVGVGMFKDMQTFYYSGDTRWYYSAGPDYYWSNYNILFKLRAERYLQGETGVKAEMFRNFKYCCVGFYAEDAWKKGSQIHMNGGFRIYVTLPPYRFKRYGKVPRINTGLSTGTTYNAGNEKVYYFMNTTLADENPFKQNEFNAEYIQSYLGK